MKMNREIVVPADMTVKDFVRTVHPCTIKIHSDLILSGSIRTLICGRKSILPFFVSDMFVIVNQ